MKKNGARDGAFSFVGILLVASIVFPFLLIVAALVAVVSTGLVVGGAFAPDEDGIGEPDLSEE